MVSFKLKEGAISMTVKKILVLCMTIVVVLGLCACSGEKKMKSVSDLAYDKADTLNYIYVLENGQYTPFLVLTDDYNGKTLLLRKEVLNENRRISDYSAYYANSEIDAYLNEEYLEALTEVSQYVTASSVEITCEDSLGVSELGTETIERCVFLLSCNEVGISDSVNIAPEGETLEFFRNEENRKVYVDGKESSWWLRTPNTYYLSCTYVIGDNNKLGYTNSYDQNGIRPAICVNGDLQVELRSDVVADKMVYVFSTEN